MVSKATAEFDGLETTLTSVGGEDLLGGGKDQEGRGLGGAATQ